MLRLVGVSIDLLSALWFVISANDRSKLLRIWSFVSAAASSSLHVTMAPTVKCPTCSQSVVFEEASCHRPFCSERCKLIDLGEWATESYVMEGPPLEEEDLSEGLEDMEISPKNWS